MVRMAGMEAGRLEQPAHLSPRQARQRFRDGTTEPTSGWCNGYQQANLVAVPAEYAFDLLVFAQRNPAPVPIIEVTEPGSVEAARSAPGSDLRTDIPQYNIWENGRVVGTVSDATQYWRDDLVTLLYGCSLTFERSLVAAGISLPHWDQQTAVPMYDTNVECASAGRLHGNLVVSMRPIPPRMVPIAVEVTARMPYAHGAPVQVGHPEALGIRDLADPDYGDPVPDSADLLPTFWACGVTLQAVLRTAKLPFAITHYPGHMFITDLPDGSAGRPVDGQRQQNNPAKEVLL